MNSLKIYLATWQNNSNKQKYFNKVILNVAIACCFILNACGPSYEEKKAMEAGATAEAILNEQAAVVTDTINGKTYNFIRSASLKCKVVDVLSITKDIEDLVALNGGYVSTSDLVSTVNYKNSIQIKKDSVLEQSFYDTHNTITMKIPTELLDTVIRKIIAMAKFVDYRRLSSEDVKLKLISNKLAESRLSKYKHNVAKKLPTGSSNEKTIVEKESALLQIQEQTDETKINTYDLVDQVNYSVVTAEIYQDQRISTQILPNPEVPEAYETPFMTKICSAFINGFELLKHCILFLINSWALILIFVMGYLLVKKFIWKNKNTIIQSNK